MVSSCLSQTQNPPLSPCVPHSPSWADGMEQDGCEASGSSRDFGEPTQPRRICPSSSQSSKEQLRRSLSHSVASGTGKAVGTNPLWQFPAQGASPVSPEPHG